MVSMTNWPKFSEGDDPDKYDRAVARVMKQAQQIRDYDLESLRETPEGKSLRELIEKQSLKIFKQANEIDKDNKDRNVTSNEI